jgi:hypothetical protein
MSCKYCDHYLLGLFEKQRNEFLQMYKEENRVRINLQKRIKAMNKVIMKKAPISIEVSYKTIGKNKIRNVIGVICPTALNQSIGYFKAEPIFVDMGDIKVNWNETSSGFEMLKLLNKI